MGRRGNKKAEGRARIAKFMATHHKKGRTWLPEWAGQPDRDLSNKSTAAGDQEEGS